MCCFDVRDGLYGWFSLLFSLFGRWSNVIQCYFLSQRYEPLDPSQKSKIVELCSCCACYPYEEEEETYVMDMEPSEYPYGSGISQLGRDNTATGTTRTASRITSRPNREIA